MPIRVSYYAGTKPGPGVKPVATRIPTKTSMPFGKTNPINTWTGKHIPLNKQRATEADESAATDDLTLDALTDTDLDQDTTTADPRPADGDMLVYDAATEKWRAVEAVDLTAEDPGTDVTTLGNSTEGTELPLLNTWTAGGTNGLVKWVPYRVVYNHSGDKVLYTMFRKETYDRYGRLYSVNVEIKVSVDVTVAS